MNTLLATLTAHTPLWWAMVVVPLLLVVGVGGAMLRVILGGTDTRPQVFTPATFGASPAALPPPADSGFPPAPTEDRAPREVRVEVVRARLATGACLYCEDAACAPLPTLTPVRHPLEGVLRYLNATPNARWVVQTARDADVPLAVCAKHHEQVVGLYEGAVAQERVASAQIASEQRLALFAFEKYACDEAMQAAMASIKNVRAAPSNGNGTSASKGELVALARPGGASRGR